MTDLEDQHQMLNQKANVPSNGIAPQPQPKSNKTGWILLLGGLGCLGLLILAAVLAALAGLCYAKTAVSRPTVLARRGSAVPAGGIPGPMRSVRYSGSPQGNRMSFEMQLYLEVLTTQAAHPSNIQELSEQEAKVVFAADGASGTATVDLASPDGSRKATMHLSFKLDKVSQDWKFTLDKLDAP